MRELRMLASLELAQRSETAEVLLTRDFATTLQRIAPATPTDYVAINSGCCLFAGKDSPLSKAVGLGMNGEVSHDDFEQMEQFFLERGGTPTIDFCPFAHASLLAHINNKNYRLRSYTAILALPLPIAQLPPIAEGITIREPQEAEAETWGETLMRGFIPTGTIPNALTTIARADFRLHSGTCFWAEYNGASAATGCMAMHTGVATFFGTSTVQAYRNKGIHTALVAHRLRLATDMGCSLARVMVQIGSASHRTMERLGFSMAYMRLQWEKKL